MKRWLYRWRGLIVAFFGGWLVSDALGAAGFVGYLAGVTSIFIVYIWPRPKP